MGLTGKKCKHKRHTAGGRRAANLLVLMEKIRCGQVKINKSELGSQG